MRTSSHSCSSRTVIVRSTSGGAPAGARSSSGVLRLFSVGRCNTARSDSNTDTVPILARRARPRGTAAWCCAQGMWSTGSMTQDGQTRGEPDDEVARAIMDHKQAERNQAYARRRAHRRPRTQAGERCAALLDGSALLGGVRTAACYVALGTEISTMPLLALVAQRGVRTLVPRVGSGAQIGWTAIGAGELRTLRHAEKPAHGTLRPDEPRGPVLQASALGACDVIVLPALRAARRAARAGARGQRARRMRCDCAAGAARRPAWRTTRPRGRVVRPRAPAGAARRPAWRTTRPRGRVVRPRARMAEGRRATRGRVLALGIRG